MALGIGAGVDPVGIRNIIGNQINPATEETLQSIATLNSGSVGFAIPQSDAIYVTYPDSVTEVYTYKLNGSTVGVVTVIYTSSSKTLLTSVTIS